MTAINDPLQAGTLYTKEGGAGYWHYGAISGYCDPDLPKAYFQEQTIILYVKDYALDRLTELLYGVLPNGQRYMPWGVFLYNDQLIVASKDDAEPVVISND